MVGRLIANRYLIEEAREQTDGGAAYSGYHLALDRAILLQILPAQSDLMRDACRRALARAERVAAIGAPRVARTLDVGSIAGRWPFVVSEHRGGQSLAHVVNQTGPLGAGRLLPLAVQAASSLQAAHAAGIVHGALTPACLWLETPGARPEGLCLMGFGLSELVSRAVERGASGIFESRCSPAGPRPGVAGTRPSSEVADVRAFGASLYEIITGSAVPVQVRSGGGLLGSDVAAGPRWNAEAAVMRALAAVIERCLSLAPGAGYASMAEVRTDLERLKGAAVQLAPQSGSASPPVTAVHAPMPRLRSAVVGGPKVIVRGG